ncbi:MAG: glycosyltransferase [Candidatus Bathyarchaeia archaeon]
MNISIARKNEEQAEYPFVSIIIATRNEEKYIARLLDSLVNQTYPKDKFEVLVIDGMSQDNTLKIVEGYRNSLNLRVLNNPKIRHVFAFNKGIDESKGDLFLIVNAHSFLKEDFVEEDVRTFLQIRKLEPRLAGVGGIYVNVYENTLGRIIGLMYYSPFSGTRSCRYSRKPHFSDSVIFGVFDKQIVISNGEFDEDFIIGQDDELPLRLISKGFKFYTNPNIVAYYYARGTFKRFIKQTFNYGVAKGLLVRKGYRRIEWFNPASFWFIPAAFLGYEIFLLLLSAFSGFCITFFVPMLLYWLISLLSSLHLLYKTKDFLCIFLPFMYFVFHNFLGISFLAGLIFGKRAFWL